MNIHNVLSTIQLYSIMSLTTGKDSTFQIVFYDIRYVIILITVTYSCEGIH